VYGARKRGGAIVSGADEAAGHARRGREAHAEEVARAMRENLKKRKAKLRARRARADAGGATDAGDDGDRALDG
jgi:hypothetical protein